MSDNFQGAAGYPTKPVAPVVTTIVDQARFGNPAQLISVVTPVQTSGQK